MQSVQFNFVNFDLLDKENSCFFFEIKILLLILKILVKSVYSRFFFNLERKRYE